MILQQFVCGPIENNTYVIVCEKTKKAGIIDPSFGSHSKIITYLDNNKYTIDKILITHAHWDHIADLKLLKNKFLCSIYIHKLDAEMLEEPQSIPSFSLMKIPGVKPDILLEDNQIINIGNIEILVLHTPGHTPGCCCFYIKNEKILFSGDTLFKGAFGRIDFPASNSNDMIQSLKKLSKLPKNVKVYPGHGKNTEIGKEDWLQEAQKFIQK